jgi:hypothetical protein
MPVAGASRAQSAIEPASARDHRIGEGEIACDREVNEER